MPPAASSTRSDALLRSAGGYDLAFNQLSHLQAPEHCDAHLFVDPLPSHSSQTNSPVQGCSFLLSCTHTFLPSATHLILRAYLLTSSRSAFDCPLHYQKSPASRIRLETSVRVATYSETARTMSHPSQNGKADGEMFLNRPQDRDSPIIEPLRINKRNSTASSAPSVNSQQNGSIPGPATSGAPSYPLPSLPNPDDRSKYPQSRNTSGSQAPYPYPDPKRIGSPDQGRTATTAYGSPTGRPGSANSNSKTTSDYPSSLRPNDGQGPRQPATLAQRRGNAPKPLPDSPGPDAPDKEGLFQRIPRRDGPVEDALASPGKAPGPEPNPYPDYHQQYWPPPGATSPGLPDGGRLNARDRDPNSINRISSTASTSTTRAQRGSPPPPETPIIPPNHRPQTDIEARYAAAGIAGTSTLTSLQAQSVAAQQRAANYSGLEPRTQATETPPRRPWTPTEQPGSHPHGQPTVYQGPGEADAAPPAAVPAQARPAGRGQPLPSPRLPVNALENDMARVHVTDEPPPAYSQTPGATGAVNNRSEKARLSTSSSGLATAAAAAAATAAPVSTATQPPNQQQHPAFAMDRVQPQQAGPARQGSRSSQTSVQQASMRAQSPQVNAQPASPPPLPEGWIAHMDPNSGQYYYIHLPTQSTQWEFPKGPTPLNLNEAPLSPAVSQYQNPLASPGLSFHSQPLGSPGLPMTPGYDGASVMSFATAAGPAGFTGPPPSSGVDLYKVAPTNGVYFGPYLRYTNMDLDRGIWLGSILLVTDAPQPPTIHIHQSVDLSPNPRQLKAMNIAAHQRWTFYKYEVDLQMDEAGPAKWTYAITSHLGCTRYEFLVAGRRETNWRFVATSGNDFSLNVGQNERARVGGIGFMWKDIMQKHTECGGFHCQLGLGSQIYADRLWKEIPSLKQWLATSGKEARKNAVWTAAHEEDVSHAYFHYYTSHFDQPQLREAFAQIPHILTIDDHDMYVAKAYTEDLQLIFLDLTALARILSTCNSATCSKTLAALA